MTRKRKAHDTFEVLEFDDDDDDDGDGKEACAEDTGKRLKEENGQRKKEEEMKVTYTRRLDSVDSVGVRLQCYDSENEEKSQSHEEGRVRRKRKKRKRKPRNNKYEGMSKKSSDGMPLEIKHVKTVSDKSKNIHNEMPSKTDQQPGIMKVCSHEQGGSTLGIDLESGQAEHKNTGMKVKKRRKKRKKVKAIEQGHNGVDDNNRKLEAEEDTNGDKLESKTTNAAIDGETEIIYASSKKKQKRRDQIWKTSRESWGHQLKSARFRFINETLYKCNGDESFLKFKGDRSLFAVYHEGYNQQIEQWPENPVDVMIEYLNKRPHTWTVGDFGCGEAKIAISVKQKVHSFDIFPANERVTVCNISKVPLKSTSIDVAVYCLSLMGINWIDYLREANRVLRPGGILMIAEVASRFQAVDSFIAVLSKLGFQLKTKDLSNKMFFLFEFGKNNPGKEIPSSFGSILKPCEYKRR